MSTQEKILAILSNVIAPSLRSHGGDVEFVSYDEASGTLCVELKGACGTCPFAKETLRMTVERSIKDEIPEVTSVIRA